VLICAAWPASAEGQGLSARFGWVHAVEGQPLEVRIELEDKSCVKDAKTPCLLDAVQRIVVQMRVRSTPGAWHSAEARPSGEGAWWLATFTSSVVPERSLSPEPREIELRADVLGARDGLLIALGEDEPLVATVLTSPEARTEDRVLQTGVHRSKESSLFVTGHVGLDGRAGSSARARAVIGVGAKTSARVEPIGYVAVGPAFDRPAILDGGPLVLGFEGAARFYTVEPEIATYALFVEPFACADLRFPGFDPGGGLRAGGSLLISADVSLEGSIGGAFYAFRTIDAEHRSIVGGVSGGLRVALRFGGRREAP
jgi:hypothetical protein